MLKVKFIRMKTPCYFFLRFTVKSDLKSDLLKMEPLLIFLSVYIHICTYIYISHMYKSWVDRVKTQLSS